MRAIVIHAPLDLRVDTRDDRDPGPGEVAVRIGAGGICGSDMHYFLHGGFGAVRIRAPMILGHEIGGTVAAIGPEVDGLAIGDRVAVNPSLPCGRCAPCRAGLSNHCTDMRFLGSAMRVPHVEGGFRDTLVCEAVRCVPARHAAPSALALAEPFAVVLHAVARAGTVDGRRVLVTGCGPIGVLAVAAARHAGASFVAATDVVPEALAHARALGADATLDTGADPDALVRFVDDTAPFDVLLECSGHAAAFRGGIEALGPRGVAVQVGLGGDVALPQNRVVAREIDVRGSFRFADEFRVAVGLIDDGAVALGSIVSATVGLDEARRGFELARDRRRAMKVQIAF